MLTLLPSVRVFLAVGVTDMRKSFDGLTEITRQVIGQDPLSGHLFLFCNRRRDRIKVLCWDGSGLWLLHKRLEKGTFAWPAVNDRGRALELRAEELGLLLGGLDLKDTTKRHWYQRPA